MMRTSTTPGLSRRGFIGGGFALGALALTGLSGCGSASGGAAMRAGMTRYDVLVHNAPFHIADAAGYYKDAGVEVPPVALGAGAEIIRSMTGDMGLLHVGTLSAMVGFAKARPDLRLIGSVYNSASVDFIVPANSPIKGLADIANAKIGVSEPGANAHYVGEQSIRASGQKATLVTVGDPNAAWTAVSTGVVDVAWGAAPLLNQLVVDGKARVAWRGSQALPKWCDTTIVSTEKMVDQKADVISDWLSAVNQGMKLITEDIEKATHLYAKRMKLNEDIARAALTEVSAGTWSLKIDQAALERVVKAGVDTGQLDGAIDLDTYVHDMTPKDSA